MIIHATALGAVHALVGPLQEAGLVVRAHRQVHRFLAPLRAAGLTLGAVARFDGALALGEVLLWPLDVPSPVVFPASPTAPPVCRVLASGLAVHQEEVAARGCEVGLALSNRAGFAALIAYVNACRPQRVSFVDRQAPPLAAALTESGIRVDVLGPPEQLDMFPAPADLAGRGADSRVS